MPVKDFSKNSQEDNWSGQKDIELLCDVDDIECQNEVKEVQDSMKNDGGEEKFDSGDDLTDADINEFDPLDDEQKYLRSDKMFQYIKSDDIREIYKKIRKALETQGPSICANFG